jgi:hypothetical protein
MAEKTFSTFVMSETTRNQIKVLPAEIQLKFFWAVTDYGLDAIEPEFDGMELAIWIPMRDSIKAGRVYNKNHLHWNWKGGITNENRRIRASSQYKFWLKSVFKRDNYTCQKCGKRGGKLNAHHIRRFAKFPELRLDVNNGMTLCADCHNTWHKEHGGNHGE